MIEIAGVGGLLTVAVGRQSARAVCCCDGDDVVHRQWQRVGLSRVKGCCDGWIGNR